MRDMLIWPLVGLVFGGPELFIFAQFCKNHPDSLLSVRFLTKLVLLGFLFMVNGPTSLQN